MEPYWPERAFGREPGENSYLSFEVGGVVAGRVPVAVMTGFVRSGFGSQRAIIPGLESSRGLWVRTSYVRWAKALLMDQDLGVQDTRDGKEGGVGVERGGL